MPQKLTSRNQSDHGGNKLNSPISHLLRLLKLIFSKYLIESKESERFTSSFPHRALDLATPGGGAGARGRQGHVEAADGAADDEEAGFSSGQRWLE